MIEKVGDPNSESIPLNFDNTEIAFRRKSDKELDDAYKLFKLINNKLLATIGPALTAFALRLGLPVTGLIKNTLFKQFCGGESIDDCESVISSLSDGRVGTILDYSVEGVQEEANYSSTTAEIIRTIQKAGSDDRVSLSVFKISGIARVELLAKVSAGQNLDASEQAEYFKVKGRVNNICKTAYDLEVPVMIDAEESWVQNAIDTLALEMMQLYNLEQVIVYNTYQLYLTNGLVTLKDHYLQAETYGFLLGAKLVRGAYLEKEQNRALALEYTSPVHSSKEATDQDYNIALKFCVQHIKYIGLVAGTHNEESCRILTELLKDASIPINHPHVYFSQLLGMSDNLSFNLAAAGYNTAKYVPYGPVKAVLPYLFRRADENTAISGQMSRELSLIIKERERRKAL
ncbi:proline dehydrogenase family protein [Paradesertivirga mongoliensis]|uniref:Proline dehydrogenase family protein n=1 Tax=Paradesertivirga mongoliensis TaxID=2100740 RepID=A0ABW4ZN08_9SPHI|nr:proline dehydrogenase family protein [Pedobacter mongoliensis]